MAGSESLTEHYEFSSMEHIFDQHKQAGMVLITQPIIIDHILWSCDQQWLPYDFLMMTRLD